MKLNLYIIWISLFAITALWTGCKDDDKNVKAVNLSFSNRENMVYEGGDNTSIQLKDTETLKLEPFFMPRNTTNQQVTYEVMGTGVFTISADGVITPLVATPETGDIPEPLGIDTLITYATDGSGTFVRYPVKVFSYVVLVSNINLKSEGMAPVIEQNATFDLAKEVTVLPANALDGSVTYVSSDPTIATVDPVTGVVTGVKPGQVIITIKANDRSGVTEESRVTVVERFTGPRNLDRSGWTVTTSHELPPDAAGNLRQNLVDGDLDTFMGLLKPGKTHTSGLSVPVGDEVYFIIDMQEKQEFEYFRIHHRKGNTTVALRVWGVSLYGSNDGVNFEVIKENIPLPNVKDAAVGIDTKEILIPKSEYRYIKMIYQDYDSVNSMSMQIAEFYLGYIVE